MHPLLPLLKGAADQAGGENPAAVSGSGKPAGAAEERTATKDTAAENTAAENPSAVNAAEEDAATENTATENAAVFPAGKRSALIRVENISYIYGKGTAFEQYGLKDVSFTVPEGQFLGIIGHTGSGKSTLIQHLDGLLKASVGKIYYDGKDIYAPDYDMRSLRFRVGLVFQYPEHQLFEENVFADVCYGPKNEGLSQEEAELRA